MNQSGRSIVYRIHRRGNPHARSCRASIAAADRGRTWACSPQALILREPPKKRTLPPCTARPTSPSTRTFPAAVTARPLVQDRRRWAAVPRPASPRWWLPPASTSVLSLALAAVALIAGVAVFPAFPIAPLVLVGVNGSRRLRGEPFQGRPRQRGRHRLAGNPAADRGRLRLVGFADHPLAVAPSSASGSPSRSSTQSAARSARLCAGASTGPSAGSWSATRRRRSSKRMSRCAGTPASSARWRRSRTAPTRPIASPRSRSRPLPGRSRRDRLRDADDESLLDLVRSFKSIGVPVSMLPRPLDLLEAPRRRRAGSAASP